MPLKGNFLTYVGDTITILRPMRSVFPRGVASKEKQSPTFSFRLTESAMADIEEAAAILDIGKTTFVRWCAHAAAMEVLKQKAVYDKSMTNSHDQS